MFYFNIKVVNIYVYSFITRKKLNLILLVPGSVIYKITLYQSIRDKNTLHISYTSCKNTGTKNTLEFV